MSLNVIQPNGLKWVLYLISTKWSQMGLKYDSTKWSQMGQMCLNVFKYHPSFEVQGLGSEFGQKADPQHCLEGDRPRHY